MNRKYRFPPLSPIGLGIALGLLWGLAILFSAWLGIFGYCLNIIEAFSSLYIGYRPTFFGGLLGALWGCFHGFIKGALLAYFYNLVTQRFSDPY